MKRTNFGRLTQAQLDALSAYLKADPRDPRFFEERDKLTLAFGGDQTRTRMEWNTREAFALRAAKNAILAGWQCNEHHLAGWRPEIIAQVRDARLHRSPAAIGPSKPSIHYRFRRRDDLLVVSDPAGVDIAVVGRGNMNGKTPVAFPLGHTSDATLRAIEAVVPMTEFEKLPE